MHLFLSHWDLDGVVSAALLVRTARVLGLSYDYKLVTPSSLPKFIAYPEAERLVVADVAPQPGLEAKLTEALKRFQKAVWIDHHDWHEEALRALSQVNGLALYLDRERAAAELTYTYLVDTCGVDLEGYEELVGLARAEDTNDTVAGDALLLRVILRMGEWELRYRLVDSLASEPRLPTWVRDVGSRMLNRYKLLLRDATRRAKVYEAWCGARIVVVRSPPSLHPGDLVSRLSGLEGDVYVIAYPDALSFRSSVVPVSRIAWLLGGSGHVRAAGAPMPSSVDLDKLVEELGRVVCRLVAEKAGLELEGSSATPNPHHRL
jgi:hypothetical protein